MYTYEITKRPSLYPLGIEHSANKRNFVKTYDVVIYDPEYSADYPIIDMVVKIFHRELIYDNGYTCEEIGTEIGPYIAKAGYILDQLYSEDKDIFPYDMFIARVQIDNKYSDKVQSVIKQLPEIMALEIGSYPGYCLSMPIVSKYCKDFPIVFGDTENLENAGFHKYRGICYQWCTRAPHKKTAPK